MYIIVNNRILTTLFFDSKLSDNYLNFFRIATNYLIYKYKFRHGFMDCMGLIYAHFPKHIFGGFHKKQGKIRYFLVDNVINSVYKPNLRAFLNRFRWKSKCLKNNNFLLLFPVLVFFHKIPNYDLRVNIKRRLKIYFNAYMSTQLPIYPPWRISSASNPLPARNAVSSSVSSSVQKRYIFAYG